MMDEKGQIRKERDEKTNQNIKTKKERKTKREIKKGMRHK